MQKISITLVPLLLSLLLLGCAHTTRQLPMTSQCSRWSERAQQVLAKHEKHTDKYTLILATNLITGAKIDAEKGEFGACIDKSSRAIKLLDPDAALTLQSGP